jgi:uncharacterized protein (DUF952 family)
MSKPVFVVTARKTDWDEALRTGSYAKSTIEKTLSEVGFIHASFPNQVLDMLNRKYRDQSDLLFLFVDPTKVTSEIKYESARSGRAGTFPHIYGPLNTDAVIETAELHKVNDRYVFPATNVLAGSDDTRFLDANERVNQWPAKHKDQMLVLEYLASKFKPGTSYSEAEVNDLLKKWRTFGDWPLLRRELFDRGFLDRKPDGSDYRLAS